MPIQIYRKQEAPGDSLANAILQGTQGFIQGRKMKQENADMAISNAYKQAQVRELERKSGAYGKPLPEGFVMTPDGEVRQDPGYFNLEKEKQKASLKAEADAQAFENMRKLAGGGSDQFAPGTTYSKGGFSIPLNPKLTEVELNTLGAQDTYEEPLARVQELVKGGVLGDGGNVWKNLQRTGAQMAAESNNPLLTSMSPKLQELQSKLAKTRELMFERGGKALTPTEQSIVGQAFVLKGKSNERILQDIAAADEIIDSKARYILGGANAARKGTLPRNPNSGSGKYEVVAVE